METPQESREADEKPNSMEDTLKEAMERMRRKHAMRTAGLLESTNESAPPEDEGVRTDDTPAAGVSGLGSGGRPGWMMEDLWPFDLFWGGGRAGSCCSHAGSMGGEAFEEERGGARGLPVVDAKGWFSVLT